MATEGNEGLGLSEEVGGGQLMDAALECLTEALMDDRIQNPCLMLESYIRKIAREECELFAKPSPALVGGREQIREPDTIILQLHFETSMPDLFFVGKKVEGRDGAICVKLIDATTGHVVASGPLSSLTLDVVVLAGDFNNKYDDDWTWEHFNSKVEQSRPEKGPLLEGELQVLLKGGVGSLAGFKFTDISTCRRTGKFRLGVKVASGFYKGIRVREAITAPFEVIHFKTKSKQKHVPRALDDDVCTLMGIGKNGAFHKNLNKAGIYKVEDFLWKLGLNPEGLRKIVGKTMTDKNWKTLGDHAKKSVPSGKYHVYYDADDKENSGVVFKNMSELCVLIKDGKYYSAGTLSDNNKATADTLKKGACANPKDIKEYDSLQLLEMYPIKRARSSQTDVVTGPLEYCCSVIDQGVSPAFLTPVAPPEPVLVNPKLDVGDDVIIDLPSPSHDPPEQADENTELSVWGYGDSFGQGKQLGGSNSPRNTWRMTRGGSVKDLNMGSSKAYRRYLSMGANSGSSIKWDLNMGANSGANSGSSIKWDLNMGANSGSSIVCDFNMGPNSGSSIVCDFNMGPNSGSSIAYDGNTAPGPGVGDLGFLLGGLSIK